MMQPSGIGQRRSSLVLEEGECEGSDGDWAEDDEDGAEGFLDALEDVFWVYDGAEFTWYQCSKADRPEEARVKEEEKEKGKAKEEEDSSDQGKGWGKGRKKGRSHMLRRKG